MWYFDSALGGVVCHCASSVIHNVSAKKKKKLSQRLCLRFSDLETFKQSKIASIRR